MNAEDTRTTPPPDGDFDPHRLRTITDMKRSKDDRLLGGVCAGAAKYLNIDPVIVRVVIAVLTLVGFAGVIIYAAAWFLLPAEGDDKSVAADWFHLDKNEEQVRVAGLVGAVVLSALAIVGDGGWFWDGVPWILVPLALVYYLFVVRPRRRRQAETALAAQYAPPGVDPADESARGPEFTAAKAGLVASQKYAKAKRDRSWTLTWLTLSVAAIATAATGIYDAYNDGPHWTAYVAVALGVVAVGPAGQHADRQRRAADRLRGPPRHHPRDRLAAAQRQDRRADADARERRPGRPALPARHRPDRARPHPGLATRRRCWAGRSRSRPASARRRSSCPTASTSGSTSDIDAGEIRVFDRKTDGTDTDLTYPAARSGRRPDARHPPTNRRHRGDPQMTRHSFRWEGLAFGLFFLSAVGNWAVWKQDLLTPRQLGLTASGVLILLGLLGVAATVWQTRPANRARSPSPDTTETTQDPIPEGPEDEEAHPQP